MIMRHVFYRVALFVIGVIFLFCISSQPQVERPPLTVDELNVSEDSVNLSVSIQSDWVGIAGCKEKVEGDTLYLTIYSDNLVYIFIHSLTGGCLFSGDEIGTLSKEIEVKHDFSNLKYIYLKCDGKKTLLWRIKEEVA